MIGATLALASAVEVLTHGPLIHLDRRVALNYWPITDTLTTQTGKVLASMGKPEWACVIVGTLALVTSWRRAQIGPICAATVGLGLVGLSTLVLKEFFPRPGIWGAPGSFPSGHTGVAVVASGLVVYLLLPHGRWRETIALAAAALWGGTMAWGRLVIESHWLSDVIAGWGIGICCLVLAIRAADSPPDIRGWVRSARAGTR